MRSTFRARAALRDRLTTLAAQAEGLAAWPITDANQLDDSVAARLDGAYEDVGPGDSRRLTRLH